MHTTKNLLNDKKWIFLLIIVIYSSIFTNRHIINVDIMEARNLITAREIVQSNNWMIPTMNGEIRIAKPPLPTWLTSVAMIIAKTDNNLSYIRFTSGMIAILLLASLFIFTKAYTSSSNIALLSTLTLSTSYLLMFMARKDTWDIFAHSFMMAAIYALYSGWQSKHLGYYIISGILISLSWMSKGPVAFYALLLPFLLSHITVYRTKYFKGQLRNHLVLIGVTIVLSSIWPLYLYFHISQEAMNVITQETQAWSSRHIKPFWYYLQFPSVSGIWMVMLLPMLWPPFAKKRIKIKTYHFLLLWTVLIIILLSIIPEKKDRYLFPVIIPLSIIIGHYLNYLISVTKKHFQKTDQVIIKVVSSLLLGLFSFSPIIISYIIFYSNSYSYLPLVPIWILFVTIIFCSIKFLKYHKFEHLLFILLLGLTLTIITVPSYLREIIPQKKFMNFQEIRNIKLIQNTPLFTLNQVNLKQIWAAGRQIHPWNQDAIKYLNQGQQIALLSKSNINHLDEIPSANIHKLYILYDKNKKQEWFIYQIISQRDNL